MRSRKRGSKHPLKNVIKLVKEMRDAEEDVSHGLKTVAVGGEAPDIVIPKCNYRLYRRKGKE